MSCGCTHNHAEQDRGAQIATRAGMCGSCRWMPPDAGGRDPCRLTIGGRALVAAVGDLSATCPAGRWPDENGLVRWRGRSWIGVPDPLRWRLLFRLGREPRVPGCGCDAGLKSGRWGKWLDPWMRIGAELRGRMAMAVQGWKETMARLNLQN